MGDQPSLLDHLPPAVLPRTTAILHWRDVIDTLTQAGLALTRRDRGYAHHERDHRAAWSTSGVLPSGVSVRIQVLYSGRSDRWRDTWRINAESVAPAGRGPHGPIDVERATIALRDPTVAEALGACAALGIGGMS